MSLTVPSPVKLTPPSEKSAQFLVQLTIERGSSSSNTSAADVWHCTIDSLRVVLKTSNRINEEVSVLWPCVSGGVPSHCMSVACCSAGLDAIKHKMQHAHQ